MAIGSVFDDAIEQKLSVYVRRDEMQKLESRLTRLEEENKRLKDGVVEFKREIYSIKDLANLMSLESSTVRKNYITTGKIPASKGVKGWEICREEYMRVMEIVKTRGNSWL